MKQFAYALRATTAVAALGTAVLAATPVWAQDKAETATAEQAGPSEIIVTGSRIARLW